MIRITVKSFYEEFVKFKEQTEKDLTILKTQQSNHLKHHEVHRDWTRWIIPVGITIILSILNWIVILNMRGGS